MSSQHSETLDNQPIPAGDGAERRFLRIGRTVFHGSERLLIGAGLICVLVYVCTRIYATAMYQAGLWSFSQLKSGSATAKYEEHGRASAHGSVRVSSACRTLEGTTKGTTTS